MKSIPDGSIDCIITSPPYWKGFAYEAYFNSYSQYIRWSKKWLSECKRVLKKDGTLWLNLGDSYIAGKQLAGIPWKVALALQKDGWVLRQPVRLV